MLKLRRSLVALMLLCGIMVGSVPAATSDTFQITVTCDFIGIVLRTYDDGDDYATWAIGQLSAGASDTMTEAEGIMVDNTANITTDLSAWVSTQAAAWANGAAANTDVYKLEVKAFDATQATPDLSSDTTAITSTSSAGDVFKSSLSATTDQWVYGKFTLPTSTSSGSQQTITVTILGSAS